VVVDDGETDLVPEVAVEAVQPPTAEQEVASVLLQLSVLLPPEAMLGGAAVNVTPGAGMLGVIGISNR
jgi:hypothetical protein